MSQGNGLRKCIWKKKNTISCSGFPNGQSTLCFILIMEKTQKFPWTQKFQKPSWLLLLKEMSFLKDKRLRQCPIYAIQDVGLTLHVHYPLVQVGMSLLWKCVDSLYGLDLEERELSQSPVSGLLSECNRANYFNLREKRIFIHKWKFHVSPLCTTLRHVKH